MRKALALGTIALAVDSPTPTQVTFTVVSGTLCIATVGAASVATQHIPARRQRSLRRWA